ncbi:MAG: hypothetical protein IKR97_03000, partial [Eubacterium sp.]|nr:hypothetical protein [Eubacterium sp.]
MKKVISLILSFVMIISITAEIDCSAFALEETTNVNYTENSEGDFTYTISDNKAVITKYDGTDESIIIPDELNSYRVNRIADGACELCGDSYIGDYTEPLRNSIIDVKYNRIQPLEFVDHCGGQYENWDEDLKYIYNYDRYLIGDSVTL